jgi:hypothetical protein
MPTRLCHCGRPKPCAAHPPLPKPRFSDRTAACQRGRKAALHRDGHRCTRCGATPSETLRLHVHHIVPKAQGGSHALENILLGDLLVLREGERLAADARILDVEGLEIDEYLLTGESIRAEKDRSRLE